MQLLEVLSLALVASVANARGDSSRLDRVMDKQHEQMERVKAAYTSANSQNAHSKRQDNGTLPFSNPAAEPFYVDGTSIPEGDQAFRLVGEQTLTSYFFSRSQLRRGPLLGGLAAHLRRPRRRQETILLASPASPSS